MKTHSVFSVCKTLILALAVFVLAACSESPQEILLQGSSMGTTWSVKLVTQPSSNVAVSSEQIQQRLDEVEEAMSNWMQESDVSRFNQRNEGCMHISEHTERVGRMSEQISLKSHGYFDPTVSPLIELWGFGVAGEPPEEPSEAALKQIREIYSYDYIWVIDGKLCKGIDDVQVNYSAIAKGYAVDQVAELMAEHGYQNYLVEVGGELYGVGKNISGNPWRVGIERPAYGLIQEVQSTLQLDAVGVATSGDYRNYYELNSVRYSHIINPKTARPVTHNAASVTVIHESTMVADGWATALLAAGAEQGMKLAEEHDLAVLMILRDGDGFKETYSSRWPQQ